MQLVLTFFVLVVGRSKEFGYWLWFKVYEA